LQHRRVAGSIAGIASDLKVYRPFKSYWSDSREMQHVVYYRHIYIAMSKKYDQAHIGIHAHGGIKTGRG
jgi:hypothetical protein